MKLSALNQQRRSPVVWSIGVARIFSVSTGRRQSGVGSWRRYRSSPAVEPNNNTSTVSANGIPIPHANSSPISCLYAQRNLKERVPNICACVNYYLGGREPAAAVAAAAAAAVAAAAAAAAAATATATNE